MRIEQEILNAADTTMVRTRERAERIRMEQTNKEINLSDKPSELAMKAFRRKAYSY